MILTQVLQIFQVYSRLINGIYFFLSFKQQSIIEHSNIYDTQILILCINVLEFMEERLSENVASTHIKAAIR